MGGKQNTQGNPKEHRDSKKNLHADYSIVGCLFHLKFMTMCQIHQTIHPKGTQLAPLTYNVVQQGSIKHSISLTARKVHHPSKVMQTTLKRKS